MFFSCPSIYFLGLFNYRKFKRKREITFLMPESLQGICVWICIWCGFKGELSILSFRFHKVGLEHFPVVLIDYLHLWSLTYGWQTVAPRGRWCWPDEPPACDTLSLLCPSFFDGGNTCSSGPETYASHSGMFLYLMGQKAIGNEVTRNNWFGIDQQTLTY